MEVLDKKLHHYRATSPVETFPVFVPNGSMVHQLLMNSTTVVKRIAFVLISKLSLGSKNNRVEICENFDPKYIDAKSALYALANNPTTASNLLDHISLTCSISVAESIAGNENASKTTLQRLSNHDSPQVRAAVTENPNASFRILACLSEDEHPDVRFIMAENACTPKSLLAKLVTDENPYVASRAYATLKRIHSSTLLQL